MSLIILLSSVEFHLSPLVIHLAEEQSFCFLNIHLKNWWGGHPFYLSCHLPTLTLISKTCFVGGSNFFLKNSFFEVCLFGLFSNDLLGFVAVLYILLASVSLTSALYHFPFWGIEIRTWCMLGFSLLLSYTPNPYFLFF